MSQDKRDVLVDFKMRGLESYKISYESLSVVLCEEGEGAICLMSQTSATGTEHVAFIFPEAYGFLISFPTYIGRSLTPVGPSSLVCITFRFELAVYASLVANWKNV